ncbi:type VII secretion target [Rhodococcus sp. HNM0569]|uniref:type VII secretion target n=1 Tax=Rhodococcus sp. HNM0569 TaxID=2716340 RepID=UPI00146EC79D|nr:type VII secretion target [Rhodococcus sp. HNM0569]NLU84339.1 hypothetical protein [Rhodococcus sp. HNM0569]
MTAPLDADPAQLRTLAGEFTATHDDLTGEITTDRLASAADSLAGSVSAQALADADASIAVALAELTEHLEATGTALNAAASAYETTDGDTADVLDTIEPR